MVDSYPMSTVNNAEEIAVALKKANPELIVEVGDVPASQVEAIQSAPVEEPVAPAPEAPVEVAPEPVREVTPEEQATPEPVAETPAPVETTFSSADTTISEPTASSAV